MHLGGSKCLYAEAFTLVLVNAMCTCTCQRIFAGYDLVCDAKTLSVFLLISISVVRASLRFSSSILTGTPGLPPFYPLSLILYSLFYILYSGLVGRQTYRVQRSRAFGHNTRRFELVLLS